MLILTVCLVIALVVIEYGIYLSWREAVRHLKEKGERNILEFLE